MRQRTGRRQAAKNHVTIQDIARRAGVSTATVSRALANPETVSETFRQKVSQAVSETGYMPNKAARNLRSQKSMTILVVVPNVVNAFWPEVLRGIDDELVADGYDLIIGNLDNLIEREERYVNLAASGQIDGALLLSGRVPVGRDRSMTDLGIPVVTLASAVPGLDVPQIVVNERSVSADIAQHFFDLGHRRFCYVAGPEGNFNELERFAGYNDRLNELGIPARDIVRIPAGFSFTAGCNAAQQFLSLKDRPTAVYAACDESAISFIKVIQSAGLSVPDDVSVVGFDGIEAALYCEPTLTTVRQPRTEMGRTGARILLDQLAGKTVPTGMIELEAPLTIEASTGPAKAT